MRCGFRLSRRGVLGAIAAALTLRPALAAPAPAVVLVVPSLHKQLAASRYYSYADLYALVAGFRPDLVGVEIRQEDLGRGDAYLHDNYPAEMIALAATYKGRVFGFDWLGEELQGRAIPAHWWTAQSRVKQLERTCDTSASRVPHARELNARLDALSGERDRIAAASTAASLAGGRYDQVVAAYYQTIAALTQGTPCAELPAWYARRDREIAAAIVAEVRRNPSRRIVVVTGADHHGPVVAALSAIGGAVVLLPVPAAPIPHDQR